MDRKLLAEIYIKQHVRSHGVLREEFLQEDLQEHSDYLSFESWYSLELVKTNRDGAAKAKDVVQNRLETFDTQQAQQKYDYSPLINYLLNKRNKLPTESQRVRAGSLTRESAWADYFLENERVRNEVEDFLLELAQQKLCYRTQSYVSTRGGEKRGEQYVWPEEVAYEFRTPDLSPARNKVRVCRLLERILTIIDSDHSDEEIDEKIYGLLEEFGVTEERLQQTVAEIPDEILATGEEFPDGRATFDLPIGDTNVPRNRLRRHIIEDSLDLISTKSPDLDRSSVEQLLERGEGQRVEFKETVEFDPNSGSMNDHLKRKVCEELCAFANSEGGTVVIGVEDDSLRVSGLDLETEARKDTFREKLEDEITGTLRKDFLNRCAEIRFQEIGGHIVSVIEVAQSDKPVYLDTQDDSKFYVRSGSSSRPLPLPEAVEYIEDNWDR